MRSVTEDIDKIILKEHRMTNRKRTNVLKKPSPESAQEQTKEQKLEARIGSVAEILRQQIIAEVDPEQDEPQVATLVMAVVDGRIYMGTQSNLDVIRPMSFFLSKAIRKAELEAELAVLNGL